VRIALAHAGRARWPLAVAAAIGLVYLVRLGSLGFWDPHELDVVVGGAGVNGWLAHMGAALGSGEAAARLPSALLGLAAAALLFVWAARVAGPRVGAMAALLCASAPLMLLESRQLIGDVGGLAGATAAVAGGCIGLSARRRRDLAVAALLIAVGGVLAYASAGAVLGIAVPAIAIAAGAAAIGRRRAAAAIAGLALVTVAAAVWGPASLGPRGSHPARQSWDLLIEQVAYGGFPWIALAPPALVRGIDCGAASPERLMAGFVAFVWVVGAWVAGTVLTLAVGPTRFAALPAAALAVALWLDDTARGRHHPAAGAVVAAALLAALLGRDLYAFPDRIATLHTGGVAVPNAGAVGGLHLVPLVAALLFAAGVVAAARGGGRLRRGGAVVAVAGCVGFAAVVAQLWIPRVSRELSARGLIDRYRHLAGPGEPLAVLGVSPRAASFYAPGARRVRGEGEAVDLLAGGGRAFAIIPDRARCGVFQALRARGGQLALLDRTRALALVSNRSLPGEARMPGLAAAIGDQPPQPLRAVRARLEDGLELVGADLPARVGAGDRFGLTLYFRVYARPTRRWEIFVHVDRGGIRFQGDHWPLDDVCPTQRWRSGDYVTDTVTVTAGDLTFPRGAYRVWVGFFVGSNGHWTNMRVTAGDADDANRIPVGSIEVR